jgi:hypothetical protein
MPREARCSAVVVVLVAAVVVVVRAAVRAAEARAAATAVTGTEVAKVEAGNQCTGRILSGQLYTDWGFLRA